MLPIHTFNVVPKLPEPLEPLREIALNLWWTWQPDARRLFRHLDPDLWHRTNHSPLRMLQLSRQARLQEVAADEDFKREMLGVQAKLRAYMKQKDTWGKLRAKKSPLSGPVAPQPWWVAALVPVVFLAGCEKGSEGPPPPPEALLLHLVAACPAVEDLAKVLDRLTADAGDAAAKVQAFV